SIPADERILLLEESRELQVSHPHIVPLEARHPTVEGFAEVSLRALLKNALRMRPDRILVGEVRGGEAFDLLQCLNTGHEGSMATIHANGALAALRRMESLVPLSGFEISQRTLREWI